MRILFVLCTAVTVLQIFDVSITSTSAAAINAPSNDPNTKYTAATQQPTGGSKLKVSRTTTREVKPKPKPAAGKPANEPVPEPQVGEPAAKATAAGGDESAEDAEPPQTIGASGKRLARTAKKVATQKGAGILNGVTGLLKTVHGTCSFFGKFLQNQSKNVRDVAKNSFGMVSSLGDNTARGAGHVLNSVRVIGSQGGKTMHSVLQKGTALGVSATKLGGTVVGTPISIAEDVVSTGHQLAKAPSRLSKAVTGNYIKPALSFMGPDSDEQGSEDGGSPDDQEEDPAAAGNVAPPTPPPTLPKKGPKPAKK